MKLMHKQLPLNIISQFVNINNKQRIKGSYQIEYKRKMIIAAKENNFFIKKTKIDKKALTTLLTISDNYAMVCKFRVAFNA